MNSVVIAYRRLHAPSDDGATLVEPPLDEAAALVAGNAQARAGHDYDFQGIRLSRLAANARRELLDEAVGWTRGYRDVSLPAVGHQTPILLAGHQPQLFHPGVWFKNFMLGRLARQLNAVAVNLVIDSDTIKSAALRVPGGTLAEPHAAAVPLDQPSSAIPYEQRPILDRECFAQFGRAAGRQLSSLVRDPLLGDFWPLAVKRAEQMENLGACLAQSRHQWEGRWGLQTLELPQSRICDAESFAWLVVHIAAQIRGFRQVYNEAVGEYRRAYKVRNAAHPVPDLAAEEPWLESPFWIWTGADPTRRPLWVRQRGGRCVLGNRHDVELELPLSPDADGRAAVERLQAAARQGIKIRSRALVTTLWARLVLGDLFLHGIGGAKYDQVTDLVIERFFGRVPPRYMVLSATMRLPVARPKRAVDDGLQVERQLRELDFHPERYLNGVGRDSPSHHLAGDSAAAELAAAKRRWIDTPQTPENAARRHREIVRLNAALQPWVQPRREDLLARRAEEVHTRQVDSVLAWREYAFCLFPEAKLRELLCADAPGA